MPVDGEAPVVAPVITQVSVVVLLMVGLATLKDLLQPETSLAATLAGQVIDASAQVVTVSDFALDTVPLQAATLYTISVLPAATAVTRTVLAFTVATAVLVLLQLPPVLPSVV